MLIFNNEFFLKFRRFLHIVIFCLLVVMVFVKYKMYNLKNEVITDMFLKRSEGKNKQLINKNRKIMRKKKAVKGY